MRPFAALLHIYVPIPVTAALSRCSDRRKSFGPSVPIAYATYVSPPDEAVAWPGAGLWCWVWLPLGRRGGVGWQIMLVVVRSTVPANHRARESLF